MKDMLVLKSIALKLALILQHLSLVYEPLFVRRDTGLRDKLVFEISDRFAQLHRGADFPPFH
jgi:hypothetical protein